MKKALLMIIALAIIFTMAGCNPLPKEYRESLDLDKDYPEDEVPLYDDALIYAQEIDDEEMSIEYVTEDDVDDVADFYKDFFEDEELVVEEEDDDDEYSAEGRNEEYVFKITVEETDDEISDAFGAQVEIEIEVLDDDALAEIEAEESKETAATEDDATEDATTEDNNNDEPVDDGPLPMPEDMIGIWLDYEACTDTHGQFVIFNPTGKSQLIAWDKGEEPIILEVTIAIIDEDTMTSTLEDGTVNTVTYTLDGDNMTINGFGMSKLDSYLDYFTNMEEEPVNNNVINTSGQTTSTIADGQVYHADAYTEADIILINYQLGHYIEGDDYEIRVLDAYTAKNIGSYTASEGYSYVVVEYEFINLSGRELGYYSRPWAEVRDADDSYYAEEDDIMEYLGCSYEEISRDYLNNEVVILTYVAEVDNETLSNQYMYLGFDDIVSISFEFDIDPAN